MMNHLKIGMIGIGGWGENVVSAWHQNPYAEVVAIADLNTARAQEIADRYGIQAKIYADYKEMIQNERLDIASVATPDFLHRQVACDCFAAGLNVFLEKPCATTMEDCEAIAEAAAKSGKKFMVDYFMRFIPRFRDAKLAMENGELGEIVQGYARIDDAISVPTKMLRWAKDSSPVYFVMIHNIDAVRWIIGHEAVEVYARQQKKKLTSIGVDTPDSVQAMVTFDNGASVLFDSNWILPRTFDGLNDQFVRLVGTEGTAYINLTYQGLQIYKPEFNEPFEHANRATVYVNPMFGGRTTGCVEQSVAHFADCVLNDKEPCITLKDAIEPTRIACAINESLKTGAPVNL